MKAWVSLAAVWAALFGLQGSLCAVACVEGPAASSLGRLAPVQAEAMPCHAAPAQPGPAPLHSDSERACGCEGSLLAVDDAAEVPLSGVAWAWLAPPAALGIAAPASAPAPGWIAPGRLPPTDIRLRTSSFLL